MNFLWNLFAKPCSPGEVKLLGRKRKVSIELTQTVEGELAKVTNVWYVENGKKCRLLAKRRVVHA